MFHVARIEVRKSIEINKDERDLAKINEFLFQYEEARRVLAEKVIQGNLQGDDNYRWKVRPEHAMGSSVKEWLTNLVTFYYNYLNMVEKEVVFEKYYD